jgi:hypothetical protein
MNISLTDALAIWGAALSSVLATLETFKFLRDKPDIGVKSGRCLLPGTYKGDPVTPALFVRVYNKGRRPVTIMDAGISYVFERTRTALAVPMTPVELLEGKSTDFYLSYADLEKMDVRTHIPRKHVAYVRDATGKSYWSHNCIKRILELHRLR